MPTSMKTAREPAGKVQRGTRQRQLEMALFIVASLLGIYGLGQGLNGLFEPGRGINLPWLAVTGIALFVLFAQMGRVHDAWPHRPRADAQPTTDSQAASSRADH
jgi:hypothetical protein